MLQKFNQHISWFITLTFMFLLLCLPIGDIGTAQASKPFIMVTQSGRSTPEGKWFNLIYTDLFRRLDLTFIYQEFPSKRGAVMLNNGQVDGDFARTYSFGEICPNAVRIAVPVCWFNISAYTANPAIRLDELASLKETTYRIDYLRGAKASLENFTGITTSENISAVNSHRSGLKKLKAGRTDIFIGIEAIASRILENGEFKYSGIHRIGALKPVFAYLYLNKKHSHLIPKFESMLKAMTEEGLLEQYRVIAYEKSSLK